MFPYIKISKYLMEILGILHNYEFKDKLKRNIKALKNR